MFISHEHKCIFVHIPKTAGTSIHSFFKSLYNVKRENWRDPEPELHHRTLRQILDEHGDCKNYFKFAFVRNPWDRLLSGYCDFVQRRGIKYSEKKRLKLPLAQQYANFEDFCIQFSTSSWCKDVHFKPQIDFITLGNSLAVDFLGRYENLEKDFCTVCDAIGVKSSHQLPKERDTIHKTYLKEYTDESSKKIAAFFADDIKLLNYDYA